MVRRDLWSSDSQQFNEEFRRRVLRRLHCNSDLWYVGIPLGFLFRSLTCFSKSQLNMVNSAGSHSHLVMCTGTSIYYVFTLLDSFRLQLGALQFKVHVFEDE